MSVFMCERWRPTDLDISLAVQARLYSVAKARGHSSLHVWLGTDMPATAAGMTAGVSGADVFVLVLRDDTMRGRGVIHEVAAALRRNKRALVIYDMDAKDSLDTLLAQADSPEGQAVDEYDKLAPADVAALGAWATAATTPVAFRCVDSSFELRSLAEIADAIFSLLAQPVFTDATACKPSHCTQPPPPLYRLRSLKPRESTGCDALFVFGPDGILAALNLRVAAAARVARRGLLLKDLPLAADAASAEAAVEGASCVVAFFSPALWTCTGAVAALRAAHRCGRHLIAFHDVVDGGFRAATGGRPSDLSALQPRIVSLSLSRINHGGNARENQVAWFIEDPCGAELAAAASDALPPPRSSQSELEAVLAGPRDAAIAALLGGLGKSGPSPSDPCAVILAGLSGAGKSTTAAAVARDPGIAAAFEDTVWVALGQACRVTVLRVVREVLGALLRPAQSKRAHPSHPAHLALPDTLEGATQLLRDVCARRSVLLVVDDVWSADAALPFLGAVDVPATTPGARASAALFTTRSDALLNHAAVRAAVRRPCTYVTIPSLSAPAAESLLWHASDISDKGSMGGGAGDGIVAAASLALFRRIGQLLPLSLVLAGACVKAELAQMLPPISAAEEAAALVTVTEQLSPRPQLAEPRSLAQGCGPVAPLARLRELHGAWLSDAAFRAALPPLRAPTVDAEASVDVTHRALQAWLGAALSAVDIPKFALFGLIPGDEFAPEEVLAAVWRTPHSHSGSGGPVCELLTKMEAAGFVKWERARRASPPMLRGSGGGGAGGRGGRALLHDVAHDFAVAICALLGGLPRCHAAFVAGLAAGARLASRGASAAPPAWWTAADPAVGSYVTSHIVSHLLSAGAAAEARALVLRLPWLQRVLRERGFAALLADVERVVLELPDDDAVRLLRAALRLSSSALQCPDAPSLLPAQLLSRLGGHRRPPPPELLRALLAECAVWRGEGGSPALLPVSSELEGPGGPLEAVLTGHVNSVVCLCVLPDGTLVSGAADKTLKVWQPSTGVYVRVLEDHVGAVTCVAALRCGRVVSGSDDTTLRVWQPATGVCEAVLRGHSSVVSCLAELPRGRVVSGSYDNSLRIWDSVSGRCLLVCEGHTAAVTCLAILPCGIVSGSGDGTLRLWSPDTGECVLTLEGHTNLVGCLAALPPGCTGGDRVASGSEDFSVRVWRIGSEVGVVERELVGHTGCVQCLAAGPDGLLLSGSMDCTLRVWRTGAAASESVLLKGHTDAVTCAVFRDCSRVVSGSEDSCVRVWDPESGACLGVLEGHSFRLHCLLSLPQGRVVSGSEDMQIRVWRPDALWAAKDAKVEGCEGGGALAAPPPPSSDRHVRDVTTLTVLPDGRVVSGSYDNTLRVWCPETGLCEHVLEGHTGYTALCVAVLPDGRIVSGSDDDSLRVWQPETGRCEFVLTGHSRGVTCVAVLPDGSGPRSQSERLARCQEKGGELPEAPLIVSGSEDASLRIWSAESGACVRELLGHTGTVNCVMPLPGRGRVVSAGDRTLRIWSCEIGVCERVLTGHTLEVTCLAVFRSDSASGAIHVVSGSDDRTLRVWDAGDGAVVRELIGHRNLVRSVAVEPDGRIISHSIDDSIRVWLPNEAICERVLAPRDPDYSRWHPRSSALFSDLSLRAYAAGSVLMVERLSPHWQGSGSGILPASAGPGSCTDSFRAVLDSRVTAVTITPAGIAVSGCSDGSVHVLRMVGDVSPGDR